MFKSLISIALLVTLPVTAFSADCMPASYEKRMELAMGYYDLGKWEHTQTLAEELLFSLYLSPALAPELRETRVDELLALWIRAQDKRMSALRAYAEHSVPWVNAGEHSTEVRQQMRVEAVAHLYAENMKLTSFLVRWQAHVAASIVDAESAAAYASDLRALDYALPILQFTLYAYTRDMRVYQEPSTEYARLAAETQRLKKAGYYGSRLLCCGRYPKENFPLPPVEESAQLNVMLASKWDALSVLSASELPCHALYELLLSLKMHFYQEAGYLINPMVADKAKQVSEKNQKSDMPALSTSAFIVESRRNIKRVDEQMNRRRAKLKN